MVGDFVVLEYPFGPLQAYDGLAAVVVTLSVKLCPAHIVSVETLAVATGSGLTVMVLLAVLEQVVGVLAVTV
jgi:hypothetical protein